MEDDMNTKKWNIALWSLQILLGLAFGMAGLGKLSQPIQELSKNMPWTAQVPAGLVRFIGLSEFVGAVGLLVPSPSRIRPGTTALAAAGLTVVMLLAVGFHLTRGEAPMAAPALVLGLLSTLVAWGRATKAPIAAKGAI